MTNYTEEIAKRLKLARIASGYQSAKTFTSKYNIPSSTYCNHENGNRSLTLENIANYAKLLNVDIAWLVTGRGSPCGHVYSQALEEKILIEQEQMIKRGELPETLAPIISETNKYSMIDVPVFKKILEELMPLLRSIPEPKDSDAAQFCFDLYNKIIATNADEGVRIDLIKLCFDSFFKGLGLMNLENSVKQYATA